MRDSCHHNSDIVSKTIVSIIVLSSDARQYNININLAN